MRGPNKMPHGNRPSKRDPNTKNIFTLTTNTDLDDYKWVCEQAEKLNISKAEVLRRCIKGSKWLDFLLSEKE